MSPAKWTSESPDLQNDLQAPRTPPFCLHAPHFGLQKNIKLLHPPNSFFFEKSTQDKIVYMIQFLLKSPF